MSRLALVLLLLIAGALSALLVTEWTAAQQDAADELREASAAVLPAADGKPAPVAVPTLPETLAALQAEQLRTWLQTTLARPLFEPDRRPQRATSQPKLTAVPRLPRLAGVLISPERRQVIFAGGDGKPIIVGEGATVDGFVVKTIAAGQVTVVGPDGAQVLRPSFDPDRKPPPAPLPLAPGIPGLPLNTFNTPPAPPSALQRGQIFNQPSN